MPPKKCLIGKSLIKKKRTGRLDKTGVDLYVQEWAGPNVVPTLNSALDISDIKSLALEAEISHMRFVAEKEKTVIVSKVYTKPEPVKPEQLAEQRKNWNNLTIPRRPFWTPGLSPKMQDEAERMSFIQWRQKLSELENNENLLLTPFERNLEIWKQLWRVIEKSQLVVQILDSRDPLLFRSPDLEKYVGEFPDGKISVILMNKADLLSARQRSIWANYFKSQGLQVAFFSARLEQDKIDKMLKTQLEANSKQDDLEAIQVSELITETEGGNNFEDIGFSSNSRKSFFPSKFCDIKLVSKPNEDDEIEEIEARDNEISEKQVEENIIENSSNEESDFKSEDVIRNDNNEKNDTDNDNDTTNNDDDDDNDEKTDFKGENEKGFKIVSEKKVTFKGNIITKDYEEKKMEDSRIKEIKNNENSIDHEIPTNKDKCEESKEKEFPNNCPDEIKYLNLIDSEDSNPDSHILNREELLDYFKNLIDIKLDPQDHYHIGMVGYPNVGKSSTVNVLFSKRRAAVSTTPGKTKHFQSLKLNDNLTLYDSPGLVFPTFMSTKAEMVCSGLLRIAEMREYFGPVSIVTNFIPREELAFIYGLKLRKTFEPPMIDYLRDGKIYVAKAPLSPQQLLNEFASSRGFYVQSKRPDQSRAARLILKDYVNGKVLFCKAPPNINQNKYGAFTKYANTELRILLIKKVMNSYTDDENLKNENINYEQINCKDNDSNSGDSDEIEIVENDLVNLNNPEEIERLTGEPNRAKPPTRLKHIKVNKKMEKRQRKRNIINSDLNTLGYHLNPVPNPISSIVTSVKLDCRNSKDQKHPIPIAY